jgi:hypothetical protein
VCPPRIEVVDHQLHHEVLGPFFLIVTLQDEPAGSGVENRDLAVENLLESERFVETFGEIEILRGYERTSQLRSRRYGHFSPRGVARVRVHPFSERWRQLPDGHGFVART